MMNVKVFKIAINHILSEVPEDSDKALLITTLLSLLAFGLLLIPVIAFPPIVVAAIITAAIVSCAMTLSSFVFQLHHIYHTVLKEENLPKDEYTDVDKNPLLSYLGGAGTFLWAFTPLVVGFAISLILVFFFAFSPFLMISVTIGSLVPPILIGFIFLAFVLFEKNPTPAEINLERTLSREKLAIMAKTSVDKDYYQETQEHKDKLAAVSEKLNFLFLEAACEGRIDSLKALQLAGADKNACSEFGLNALQLAMLSTSSTPETIDYLKNELELKEGPMTPLHAAASKGDLEQVKQLVDKGSNINAKSVNSYVIHHAIRSNNFELVTYLINKDIKLDVENNDGEQPLHYAVKSYFLLEKSDRTNSDQEKILNLLLEKSADINHQDHKGNTLLHLAILNGEAEKANFIMTWNPDLHLKNNDGKTVLDLARVKKLSRLENEIQQKAKEGSKLGSGAENNTGNKQPSQPLSQEALRERRVAFFDKKSGKTGENPEEKSHEQIDTNSLITVIEDPKDLPSDLEKSTITKKTSTTTSTTNNTQK